MDLETILKALFEQFDVDSKRALSYHQLKAASIAIDLDEDFDVLYEFDFPEDSYEAALHRVPLDEFMDVFSEHLLHDKHRFVDQAFSLISEQGYSIEPKDIVDVTQRALGEENQVDAEEAEKLVSYFAGQGDTKIYLPVFREIMDFPSTAIE